MAGCDYDLCQYCVASVHCRGNSIVAKDGYLYVTDSNKPGIFKLGTGARGTASAQTKQVIKGTSVRGFTYLRVCSRARGWRRIQVPQPREQALS